MTTEEQRPGDPVPVEGDEPAVVPGQEDQPQEPAQPSPEEPIQPPTEPTPPNQPEQQ